MRKFVAICVIALVGLNVWGIVPALAHHDKYKCSHGDSNKPCRPDPQPDHGRDCDHPHFGINQDHCLGTPTPTPSPTVTPTPTVVPTPTPTPTATPTEPEGLGGGEAGPPQHPSKGLAHTGSAPLMLLLYGDALVLLGVGLRLQGKRKSA